MLKANNSKNTLVCKLLSLSSQKRGVKRYYLPPFFQKGGSSTQLTPPPVSAPVYCGYQSVPTITHYNLKGSTGFPAKNKQKHKDQRLIRLRAHRGSIKDLKDKNIVDERDRERGGGELGGFRGVIDFRTCHLKT